MLLGLLLLAACLGQDKAAPVPSTKVFSVTSQDLSAEPGNKLLMVRRIYVESFGEDAIAKQVQAMVISSLTESNRFVVTENREKADAVLKGTALEKTSQEYHSSSESTAVGGASGGYRGGFSGSTVNGSGSVSGHSSGGFSAGHAAIADSEASTETINDARVAVRLLDADGDVIWTTTQESRGAKYKGASADVADKVTKQLLHDIEKLQKKMSVTSGSLPTQTIESVPPGSSTTSHETTPFTQPPDVKGQSLASVAPSDSASTSEIKPAILKHETTGPAPGAMPSDTPGTTPSKGKISITSTPDGAEIYVDSIGHGRAPAILELSAGTHSVQLVMRGYKDWVSEVPVKGNSVVNVTADLEK